MSMLNINMDELYDELKTINVTVGRLSKEEDWKFKNSAAKWMPVFQTRDLPNMLSVVSYILSVPSSTGYVEKIFSIIQNKWSDTRNRCSVELIKCELIVALNFEQSCGEFFTNIGKNKKFLAAARSNTKYTWKNI